MIAKLKKRLASEEGFTLIELLIVIIIIGILVLAAGPSYLSLRQNAKIATSKSNVHSAILAAETFYEQSDPTTYTGVSRTALNALAAGIGTNVKVAANAGGTGYCIEDAEGTAKWRYAGGTGGSSALASGGCNHLVYTVGDVVTG